MGKAGVVRSLTSQERYSAEATLSDCGNIERLWQSDSLAVGSRPRLTCLLCPELYLIQLRHFRILSSCVEICKSVMSGHLG
ncbi:hypothetical protein FPSE_10105 [Fusarium pseudograminearum CS3096]|uniref:Uncharacterized protein n=1 Tax=Fusarium pseudograminearum (strain CS3096) TaxID=1028729 RepID=K3UDP6_FUSPC|nr:hypothetical protein FPSE_10105 [Fusarium pseudograminearum CS3096]EKJ69691.1 hypothetical protein FPSE_10105 [Fusarium pseudograminearum CS3096]